MKSNTWSILSAFSLICYGVIGFAQTPTQNYIHSFDVQVAGVSETALDINTNVNTALQTIQYFDGLGRLSQTVQKGITPGVKDLVQPVVYNNYGLDEKQYQPYESGSSTGEFRSDFYSELWSCYGTLYEGDTNGKAPIEYEKSPLNRVLRKGAPGDPWQLDPGDHPVSISYLSNSTSDDNLKAFLWDIDGNTCLTNDLYRDNQLYVTRTLNEDGAENYEFKDKQGQILLKRSILDDGTRVDTYYIYDDLGLLRYVISPEGSAQVSGSFSFGTGDDFAKYYVYCYTYDSRKRLIEKQIPGKDVEYYIYNKNDLMIMYQDGNMRKNVDGNPAYEWIFTKYDALGRVIITGICAAYPTSTRDQVQLQADANSTCWEYVEGSISGGENDIYSDNAFPTNYGSYLTINYYDTYDAYVTTNQGFKAIYSDPDLDFSLPTSLSGECEPELNLVSGLPTISMIQFEQSMLTTVTYYDNRGRMIQTRSQNQANGHDFSTTVYGINNLTARPSNAYNEHTATFNGTTDSHTESISFLYDGAGRLTDKSYTLDDLPKHKIQNTYNALGQLTQKDMIYGEAPLQTINYKYNIRGWLTQINDPDLVSSTGYLFGMKLLYNKVDSDLGNDPLFNGNISSTIWRCIQPTGLPASGVTGIKAYKYSYDNLNRILESDFYEYNSGVWSKSDIYTERIYNSETGGSYDLNGNIQGIVRQGLRYPNNTAGKIDDLQYHYCGNKLIAVNDAVSGSNWEDFTDNGVITDPDPKYPDTWEYNYDANGNLVSDKNKGIILITYDHQNLPNSINMGGDNRVEYLYDAAGSKRKQNCFVSGRITKTTDFINNYVYENGNLAWILNDEGRIFCNVGYGSTSEFFLKDHLGNVRVAFRPGENGIFVQQVDSYYPFGFNQKGLTLANTDYVHANEYLYNGKMMQDEMGLNWLDYGARFYDQVLGRWHSVDPHAENYYSWSPYHYAANNPIIVTDPTGMDWYTSTDGSATMWKDGSADIDGYTNIGANYTQDIGGGTSVTYTQNEATSMTFTGAEESSWESQITNGTNCYQASSEMLQNEGVETAGRGTEVLVTGTAANGRAGDANANASTGFAVVDQALENGNPIMVGVDYKNGSPNADGRTDHFVVVSSKTETLNNGAVTSTTYNYFDPRTSHQNYGTSSNNQLTISNNKMTGSYNHGGSNYNYTVTTVRRNR